MASECLIGNLPRRTISLVLAAHTNFDYCLESAVVGPQASGWLSQSISTKREDLSRCVAGSVARSLLSAHLQPFQDFLAIIDCI